MKRTFTDYLWLFFKGMAMGAADIVPGVSGGTIAFISGIYEELISSLSQFRFSLFSELKNKGFKTVWRAVNGNFLITVFWVLHLVFCYYQVLLAGYYTKNQS